MLVSSKHLMLASPVFKAMLRHGAFSEGAALQTTGKAQVPLPDDNPEAFEIVLNLIHGHSGRVPTILTFDMMTNLAILVDKYQMLDLVKLCVHHLWMPRLPLPRDIPHSELAEWLAISWVFRLPAQFKEITRRAICTSFPCFSYPETYLNRPLPIPGPILGISSRPRAIVYNTD